MPKFRGLFELYKNDEIYFILNPRYDKKTITDLWRHNKDFDNYFKNNEDKIITIQYQHPADMDKIRSLLPYNIFYNFDVWDKKKNLWNPPVYNMYPELGYDIYPSESCKKTRSIIIHPFGHHIKNTWTRANWDRLGKIYSDAGYDVTYCGDYSNNFLDMNTLWDKINKASLWIGVDTGTRNIALLCKTPVVELGTPGKGDPNMAVFHPIEYRHNSTFHPDINKVTVEQLSTKIVRYPKITFGMIVKNGMPFVEHSIKSVYNFAHQMIVVDGGSTDGTIKLIKDMMSNGYDKIQLVQGEWSDKTNQCNEYAKLATGDFLWQLDSDEIYKSEEIEDAIKFLMSDKKDVYKINIINFFRDIKHVVTGGMWSVPPVRVFRINRGDLYNGHRPPTMIKNGKVIKSDGTVIPGINIYHYSHIGKNKVKEKAEYYSKNMKDHPIYSKYNEWYKDVYLNNITTNLHITGDGVLSNFNGNHPESIEKSIKIGVLHEYCGF
jgi:hypothetical protein